MKKTSNLTKVVIVIVISTMFACGAKVAGETTKASTNNQATNNNMQNSNVKIRIKTTAGDMTVLLYNETPLHKANFIKLVKEKYYDGQLFHRVIQKFMIQAGDPDSKTATSDQMLGSGGPGYTINAELNPKFIHKKGALAAARQGDNVNPERKSSGSQFYIVQGELFTDAQIQNLDAQAEVQALSPYIRKYLAENPSEMAKVQKKQTEGDKKGLDMFIDSLATKIKLEHPEIKIPKYTNEQKNIYKNIGGSPFLDRAYTVFGEVIDGLDVIDKIAAVQTNAQNRPIEDVKIISMEIL